MLACLLKKDIVAEKKKKVCSRKLEERLEQMETSCCIMKEI